MRGLPAACWCLLLVLWAGGVRAQAVHLTQAQMATAPAASFAPASVQLDTAALPPLAAWRTVDLPTSWQRDVLPGGVDPQAVQTTWFRIDLAAQPQAAGARRLYLPRWQTIGQIAVYGDARLLYRSDADLVWNGFNHPLWIALPADAPLRWITIRIDSRSAAGGALSSAWAGSDAALAPRYELRRTLQVRVPEFSGVAVLGLGAFAFAVWLLRRKEKMYLLFAAFALVSVLRGLHFHLGDGPLPIASSWFGWMTVNAVTAMLVAWVYFIAALVRVPARWIGPALVTLMVVAGIATLPPLAVLPGMDRLAPLSYLLAIAAGVPTILYLTWLAWRDGGREVRLAAAIGCIDVVVAVHDWMMQNFLLGPEGVYYNPMLSLVRLLMFVYVILRRYVGAVDAAEQSSLQLARRLREREAELAESYERLREVQQRQLLARERQRLMQDIHDGMGSQLMSALRVAEAGQLSDQRMAEVLRECIDDLKLTVDSLEPVEADLHLLLATLRYRLEPRLQGAGLVLRWAVGDLPALPWLDPRSALHVLRILQEAIANVMQHAGATELRLATRAEAGGVSVLLTDNGRGFDLAGTQTAGKGLSNMLRRADAVGGRIDWTPQPQGTSVRLWLPLVRS
ncbi:sensor histidine kinase [Pseudorhodoferax sp.]|uniref:sensor histidine kinase n=1 Tax=Pseudorhodoferax sp. TaxID=1993553 RepID=UPI002DD637A5|nr:sensor histidine kinase [Pseudorhodoferax sp.]